jgi:hypothetical protein
MDNNTIANHIISALEREAVSNICICVRGLIKSDIEEGRNLEMPINVNGINKAGKNKAMRCSRSCNPLFNNTNTGSTYNTEKLLLN